MSQKVTRKSQNTAATDEKEKRQTDSPVKDMKKKMAANAEKEKQQQEKADKTEKVDKNAEKSDKTAEKSDKSADKSDKSIEKSDKGEKKDSKGEKKSEKVDKVEKKQEKVDKKVEKQVEKKADKPVEKKADNKPVEKKPEQAEKKEDGKSDKKDEGKIEKNGKESSDRTSKQNGGMESANGDGTDDGSSESEGAFPELAYLDRSDSEEETHPRALTRREQVKATKTPETPRPASDKDYDDSKVLKLSETAPVSDRKLRSSDSPKPDPKKAQEPSKTAQDNANKEQSQEKKDSEQGEKKESGKEKEIEMVVEVEGSEVESRMKTRARVSPYTRPAKHDHTITSVMANYTGNNTTMEMDITETSSVLEDDAEDSSFLRGLRNIRGRASYRAHEQTIQQILANRSFKPQNEGSSLSESYSRPTAPVVGRKRKPPSEVEVASEAVERPPGKRSRLLDRLTTTLRQTLPIRSAEIVGINTDLPLTAPVASSIDPESLKEATAPVAPQLTPLTPQHTPLTPTHTNTQEKRCVIM